MVRFFLHIFLFINKIPGRFSGLTALIALDEGTLEHGFPFT